MGNAVDHHTSGAVINGIQDSIRAYSQAVGVWRAFKFFCVERSRIVGKRFDCVSDRVDDVVWQTAELTGGGGGVKDTIHGQAVSTRHAPATSE